MQESLVFGPGFRSGNLVVLELTGSKKQKNGQKRQSCRVQCSCGLIYETFSRDLYYREIKNCTKCNRKLQIQRSKIQGWGLKHGLTKTREYRTWVGIKQRCNNSNSINFPNYGARGIKVCERWNKFENFFHDMGKKPFEDFQIDRIDPDGNYEPSNCRWVSSKENIANRRCSRKNRDRFVMIDKHKLCEPCRNNHAR